ncbi:hypothetical protein MYP_4988 [Sporocytophaga myxococcoides]|uniref:Uncharacterized protein n=1 Tax=Sporocytophaga myxococcoides TaxID=153721 RepID=A0A098LN64_9BACT|nr:hypothetical protein [Sporocytophaga myxococcoides]GAL87757.1 hypothetical protein MYP_4988 [Sporocytophaga myxococcoides]
MEGPKDPYDLLNYDKVFILLKERVGKEEYPRICEVGPCPEERFPFWSFRNAEEIRLPLAAGHGFFT